MNSVSINKKYKVTIEFEVTLDQVRDYGDMNPGDFKRLVEDDVEDLTLITNAANHIASEVKGYHEEEECIYFDSLDFTVDEYKLKTIEE